MIAQRRPRYRTGRKNARNIYRIIDSEMPPVILPDDSNDPYLRDEHIGCMFTEPDGELVVAALNFHASACGPGEPANEVLGGDPS